MAESKYDPAGKAEMWVCSVLVLPFSQIIRGGGSVRKRMGLRLRDDNNSLSSIAEKVAFLP